MFEIGTLDNVSCSSSFKLRDDQEPRQRAAVLSVSHETPAVRVRVCNCADIIVSTPRDPTKLWFLPLCGRRRRSGPQRELRSGWSDGCDVQLGGVPRSGPLHHLPAGLSTQPQCAVSGPFHRPTVTAHRRPRRRWSHAPVPPRSPLPPLCRWERCCVKPAVRSGSSGKVLMFSCSLTVTHTAHLLLELQPTHTAKTFKANEHSECVRVRVCDVGKQRHPVTGCSSCTLIR